MKVILRKEIETLGNPGDIKEVKLGYARNFLLPRGLAVLATPNEIKNWGLGAERRKAKKEKAIAEAKKAAGKMDDVMLSFAREVGEDEKLFGSVGKVDIVKSIKVSGYEVTKDEVLIDSPIKIVGDTEVKIKLKKDVFATIKVRISPKVA
jgi:large subunit ribosomal protein L9